MKNNTIKKISTAGVIAFNSSFAPTNMPNIMNILKLQNKQEVITVDENKNVLNTNNNDKKVSIINIDELNFSHKKKKIDNVANDEELNKLFVKIAKFYGIESIIIENVYNQNYDSIINSSNPGLKFIKSIEKFIKDNKIKLKNKSKFKIGVNNKKAIKKFKKTKMGKIYTKYGEIYGVDPDILIARDMQESGLSSNTRYNPSGATGPSQIEYSLIGSKFKVYNCKTKKYEIVKITKKKVTNLDQNIKLGTMRFANCLNRTHGNIYAALQWYNYGNVFKVAIRKYAKDKGISVDDVLKNTKDLGWQKYIDDIHNNPGKYINGWRFSTYGDKNYYKKIVKNVDDPDNVLEFPIKEGLLLVNLNNKKKITISNKTIKILVKKRSFNKF